MLKQQINSPEEIPITFINIYLFYFIYLGFYITFNTVQVISQRVVRRAEETSTLSLLGFFTVNCQPMASNYQLSHLRSCRESNPGLRGGRRECYHSATVAPFINIQGCFPFTFQFKIIILLMCYFTFDPLLGPSNSFKNGEGISISQGMLFTLIVKKKYVIGKTILETQVGKI